MKNFKIRRNELLLVGKLCVSFFNALAIYLRVARPFIDINQISEKTKRRTRVILFIASVNHFPTPWTSVSDIDESIDIDFRHWHWSIKMFASFWVFQREIWLAHVKVSMQKITKRRLRQSLGKNLINPKFFNPKFF